MNDVLIENAKGKIIECRDYVQELSRGQVRTSSRDIDLMFRATDSANRTLKAISVSNPTTGFAWWHGEIGKKYLDATLRAMDRAVSIERIFVYEKVGAEVPDEVLDLRRNMLKREYTFT